MTIQAHFMAFFVRLWNKKLMQVFYLIAIVCKRVSVYCRYYILYPCLQYVKKCLLNGMW